MSKVKTLSLDVHVLAGKRDEHDLILDITPYKVFFMSFARFKEDVPRVV